MDIPVAKVRKILKIAQEPISLETPIGEEEDSHLGDFIEDKAVVSPSDAVINLSLKEQTSSVLKTLTPRKKKLSKCALVWTTAVSTRSKKSGSHSPSPASASARSRPKLCASYAIRRARASSAPSLKVPPTITRRFPDAEEGRTHLCFRD